MLNLDSETPLTNHAPGLPPLVWILQRRVIHYRLPVFDLLVERSRGRHRVKVIGGLDGDRPYGAKASRSYIDPERLFEEGSSLEILNALRRRLARERPRVVISQIGPRLPWSWLLPGLCRLYGAAPVGFSKVYSARSRAPSWMLWPVKRTLFRRYPSHIVYGEVSRRELVGLGIASEDVFVVRNTIDTRHVFESQGQIEERGRLLRRRTGVVGRRVLLMMGKLEPQKRHHDVLRAWPELRSLDDDLVLLIVGDGSLRDQIEQHVEQMRDSRVLVLGGVPEGDDYAWLATADFNLQAGAVGLAINQSMALGTPTVIADELGPDAEIVEHGRTGWRYRRGNLGELVSVLRFLLEHPETVGRVTDEARRKMREEVTLEHMVEQFRRAIEHATAPGAKGSQR